MLVARLLQLSIGTAVIGSMAVTLTISFAALIYTGPLAPHLGKGASLALLGGAVMAAVGCFTHSIRGVIANPQDATAVVLGSAALGIVSAGSVTADTVFPTVVALTVAACAVAGGTVLLAGLLRLGAMVRFAPYPVIAGFLAATGYLLVMGSLAILAREGVTIYTIAEVIRGLPPSQWLPWIAAGLVLAVAGNLFPGAFTLPAALFLATVGFFAFLAFRDISLEAALAQGMLLGPFEQTAAASVYDWQFLQKIEWAEIVGATPTLAAVAGLALLGSLLNITGFAMVFRQDSDTERDMRATGLANLASASVGGLPGYIILGESILARRLNLPGHVPGLIVAVACATAAIAGTEYIAYAPAGLMAMVVAYLGFDLLGTWLLSSWRRLSIHEYAVVLLIVLVTATFGFLEALALGTLATAVIFVFAYAKTDVIRARTTLAHRRSWVERSEEEAQELARAGHVCAVLKLSGFLFFGTADRVARLAKIELHPGTRLRFLILDMDAVTGLDASASASLLEVVRAAQATEVEITLCGLTPELERQIRRSFEGEKLLRFNGPLDSELERVEEILLKESLPEASARPTRLLGIVQRLERDFADRPEIISRERLREGEELLARGSRSSDVYVLCSGQLRAEVPDMGRGRRVIAKFRGGALIGQVAHYAGVPRTAWIMADMASEVARIDLEELRKFPSPSVLDFHRSGSEAMARRLLRMTEHGRDGVLNPS